MFLLFPPILTDNCILEYCTERHQPADQRGRTIIKVKVYAPAFINHEPISADGTVTLADRATLNDLYSRLKIPITLRLVCFCSVNYEAARWNTKLEDGDTVTFLFPISGG